jgi:hypothetical protein
VGLGQLADGWAVAGLCGQHAEPTNQSGFRSIKIGIAVRQMVSLAPASTCGAEISSSERLAMILKFVFRLPLDWTRLHENQMWRSAVDGPVAFDRLHERPALNRSNPAAGAVEPIKGV